MTIAPNQIAPATGHRAAPPTRERGRTGGKRTPTEVLLDQAGVRPGDEVLSVGCGAGGVLHLLAERVGPCGRVIGLDDSPAEVTRAKALVDRRGLAQVTVLHGDVSMVPLPSDSQDMVHAHGLRSAPATPHDAVAEMVRVTKPGGWVVSAEVGPLAMCEPRVLDRGRLAEVFRSIYALDAGVAQAGTRLPDLFRAAGLAEVGVDVGVEVGLDERGDSELELLANLVVADEGRTDGAHLVCLTWGRKP